MVLIWQSVDKVQNLHLKSSVLRLTSRIIKFNKMKSIKSILLLFLLLSCISCSDKKAEKNKKPLPDTAKREQLIPKKYNGIDVSHHNGLLNWEQIAADPCIQFVYIKATEGANYVDTQYSNNVTKARQQDILVGAYHYFNSKPAQQQFKNYSSVVKKNQIDLIPVIDVEAFGLRAYQGNWKNIRQNLLSLQQRIINKKIS